MTVYVTEHWGHIRVAQQSVSVPLAAYSLSSATGQVFTNPTARFVRVTSDAGSLVAWSTSTGVGALTLTSTNAIRIPTGIAQIIEIPSPYGTFALSGAST